ncbi:MAG: bifunctional enoyl-CoA hydratase/phosphate acetyltransferase [Planctomycetota bacterium]
MICVEKVEGLVALVRGRQRPVTVACAAPEDSESLEALRMAADEGIAKPLAVGPERTVHTLAQSLGISLDGFRFRDVPGQEDVPGRASQLVRDGEADILMKGHLSTKSLIQAVLDQHTGLRTGRMLSQVALFDAPLLGRPVLLTDCAVNIRPNFAQKIEILKNAAEIAQKLGVKRPKVAVLAAVEYVELPAMPATLDARLLERMAEAGELGDVVVQGPLALDDAVSRNVVRTKAISGPVAGRADILLAPEIEAANCCYKALTCFAGLEGASIVGGASAPVVLAARADSARAKFLSIAFAAAMIEA